ncbi:MAG: AI-2E family transporter [Pseudomonadota bacterium]
MKNTTDDSKIIFRFPVLFWVLAIFSFFYFISLVKSILLPFIVGILTAYFLDPLVGKLCRRNFSRTSASAFITIIFFSLASILCFTLLPLISEQLASLIHNLPEYFHSLQEKYGDQISKYITSITNEPNGTIKDAFSNFSGNIAGILGELASDLLKSGLAVLNIFSLIFITPIVAFYLLRDWDKVVVRFDKLLPRKYESVIIEQLKIIDNTLSGFIRGQTNVSLIMALYYSIALSIAGLNFALVIGIISGLLLFIPFVGYSFCFALASMISFLQFGFGSHLFTIVGIYILGMIIEGSFLTPRLIGSKVGLHPLWIIFGMLAGAAIFGFVGILISVPVTAIIGVLVRFLLDNYLKSSIYLEQ